MRTTGDNPQTYIPSFFKDESTEPSSSYDNNPGNGEDIAPQTASTECVKAEYITFADIVGTEKEKTQTQPAPQEQVAAEAKEKAAMAHNSKSHTSSGVHILTGFWSAGKQAVISHKTNCANLPAGATRHLAAGQGWSPV